MSATEDPLTNFTPADRPDDRIEDRRNTPAGNVGRPGWQPQGAAYDRPGAGLREPGPSRRRTSTAVLFILALSVTGGILAGLWAAGQGERYSATAVVQLEPASTIDDNNELVDVVGSLDRGTIIVTAAGLASSGVVTSAAQEQAGLSAAQAEDYEVESLQVLTSHLIDITVSGPDEATAIVYADAIADELKASFTESYPVYGIETVTPATVPDSSGRPGVTVVVIAAMVASAVGGLMLWLALFGGSDDRTDLPLARRS